MAARAATPAVDSSGVATPDDDFIEFLAGMMSEMPPVWHF